LNDPTLEQGDVISTGKGFVVFVGREEEHQPNDFLSVSFLQQTQNQRQRPR
jgi:hypothetical protein